MIYFILTWIAFGFLNVGGYSQQQGATKSEAILFFFLGPVVTFVWLGSVLFNKIK